MQSALQLAESFEKKAQEDYALLSKSELLAAANFLRQYWNLIAVQQGMHPVTTISLNSSESSVPLFK